MAQTVSSYVSMNGGELSPEVQGRVDLSKYQTGLALCENFIVHAEGGAHRRPGTRYISGSYDSTRKSRLVPFVFSREQAYMLEFSHNRIRIFANEAKVLNTEKIVTNDLVTSEYEFKLPGHGYEHRQGPVRITASSGVPAPLSLNTDYYIYLPQDLEFTDSDVVTSSAITFPKPHNLQVGTLVGPYRPSTDTVLPGDLTPAESFYLNPSSSTTLSVYNSSGTALANLYPLRSSLASHTHKFSPEPSYRRDTFRLSTTNLLPPVTLTSTGTAPHTITPDSSGIQIEIESPYTEGEIFELQFTQSADILFITHKNHPVAQLSRTSNTSWTLGAANIVDGPYGVENTDPDEKVQASAVSGTNITLTRTSTSASPRGWKFSDIGRLIRIKNGTSDWGYVEIIGVQPVSGSIMTEARANVRSVLGSTVATEKWRFGSIGQGDYPIAISFAEQRLWLAGESSSPQKIHGSKTADFLNFAPSDLNGTVQDASAIDFQLGTNQVNAITWLVTGLNLYCGTTGSVFIVRSTLNSEAITPTNVNLQSVSTVSSLTIQPVPMEENILFVTRNSQSLRSLHPNGSIDLFEAEDISLLAKHIFGRTASVTTMAYQQDRQQVLWMTLSNGSLIACTYVPSQQVNGFHRHTLGGSFQGGSPDVESVAVIPSPDLTHDQVWMVVRRTINGSDVRYIEIMEDEWLDQDTKNMRFVDSAPVAYSGAPVSSVSGLSHLEGETVQVIADGTIHPDRVVSGGSITLDASYSDVVVGLQYTSNIETLRLELPDRTGSSMGRVGRIDHAYIRLMDSSDFEVGPSSSSLSTVSTDGSLVFNGDKQIVFSGGFQREKKLFIRQSKPSGLTVLAINLTGSVGTR